VIPDAGDLTSRVFMQWNVPAVRDHPPTAAAMTELRRLVAEAIAQAWDEGYETGFGDGFNHGLTEGWQTAKEQTAKDAQDVGSQRGGGGSSARDTHRNP
jgi:hypothetical protein